MLYVAQIRKERLLSNMSRLEGMPIRGFAGLGRESVVSAETKDKLPSVAVAVLIVGLDSSRNGENGTDPLIWTITELTSKLDTDKVAGQISIPAETRKDGESEGDNVLGALTEFCDDTAFLSYLKHHVVKMDGNWLRGKGAIVNGKPVDVAILIYDGALDFPLKPTCSNEVAPKGWVRKSELIANPNLRDVARQVLELDTREDLIRSALENYRNDPQGRQPIFPQDLDSIEKFRVVREHGVDIRVMDPGEIEVYKRLPEAQQLISSTITLLTRAQKQEKRDLKKEEQIVAVLKEGIKNLECRLYSVGIDEVEGLGIKRVNAIKDAWKRKDYREFYQRCYPTEKAPDVYRLQEGERVEKSWGNWWLTRGDKLGYEELGENWFLVFSGKYDEGNSNLRGYTIVPVDRIRSFKLKTFDKYGM
jgi:hypothetical protein